MLRLDLAQLGRDGSVHIEARVPSDHALLQDLEGVAFDGPVDVRLRASEAGSGEVIVRGTVEARLDQQCRRCLEAVRGEFHEELTLVFVASEDADGEDDGDLRVFDGHQSELDLGEVVREELVLSIDPYVVCRPECKGLCPECGANRNNETCSCTHEELDPRWDALRALTEE